MKTPRRRFTINVVMILLAALLFIAAYTLALQLNYRESTVESAVEWDTKAADAMYRMLSDRFTWDDFHEISNREDMELPRYQNLQQRLNELRSFNATRYLYTAKRDENGRLVYVIDGLDLGAEDFAYPGTYIEEEMIPYISSALDGQTVYSRDIVDTTWGHIFTACYPLYSSDKQVIGALCVEIDMEHTYENIAASEKMTLYMALIVSVVLMCMAVAVYAVLRKQKLEETRQQEALAEAARAADAANQAKSTFLFNMSHDIRTPMNAILGFTELARKNLDSREKLQGYLDKIQVSGDKMLAILDKVLELARIESGKTVVEEAAVETQGILDACLTMVQPEAEKKNQTITVRKEVIYPYIYLDTTLVSEIVLNLMSNSIKYTGAGGKITCSMYQKSSGKNGFCTLVLQVQDNGIGMSEEFQTRIYESFSRERSSTASGVEGTGLGMGIVKKLVDKLNGTIHLQSRLGEGSTFTVELPCRIASQEDTKPKKAMDTLSREHLRGKRILLAEDNALNAEIAMELLSEEGVGVDWAENGVACVEMLDKAPAGYYDLILMDVQMPILDGYDAAQKIRRLPDSRKAGIPIVAMTANAFAEDRKKALEVGMNDHVAKPIDMNKLIPTLLKYL